jgi:hypothetical protein
MSQIVLRPKGGGRLRSRKTYRSLLIARGAWMNRGLGLSNWGREIRMLINSVFVLLMSNERKFQDETKGFFEYEQPSDKKASNVVRGAD